MCSSDLGCGDDERRALRDYGMNLGTAFQLVDDFLDFTSDEDSLGKAAGVDLLEGKVTLPFIYLLEERPDLTKAVQAVMREGSYEEHPRASFMRAAEKAGALERARTRAAGYAEAASSSLDGLRPSEHTEALRAIPSYILEREM